MEVEIITRDTDYSLQLEINRRLEYIGDKLIDIKYNVYVYGDEIKYSCMIIKRKD